ncbi:MAG: hypothetical protein IPJ79_05490 [Bacteroidetes bacterium]|nr:hypothetical protein [Bacteroidota bacterium]
MKRKLVFVILFLFYSMESQCQGISNRWLMGYGSWSGVPFGQTEIDFFTGTPILTYKTLEMDFKITHSNISNSNGDLLFIQMVIT